MLTISLSRHGLTPGNLRRAYVGSTDQPLCPQGREELGALAGEYPPVERIYTSPLVRCVETAALLYPGQPLHPVEDLRERHFGRFENLSHSEIIALPGYRDWGMTAEGMIFPNGEELESFTARCTAAFWQVVGKAEAEGITRAAVVTHGGVIMALMEEFCRPSKPFYQWQLPNGGGYLLDCLADSRQLTLIRRLGV